MKLKKSEKIWLGSVLFFFIVYNMPFLPAYNNIAGTLIHAALTLIPLWICVYAGLFKVSDVKDPSINDADAKDLPAKDAAEKQTSATSENRAGFTAADKNKEEFTC